MCQFILFRSIVVGIAVDSCFRTVAVERFAVPPSFPCQIQRWCFDDRLIGGDQIHGRISALRFGARRCCKRIVFRILIDIIGTVVSCLIIVGRDFLTQQTRFGGWWFSVAVVFLIATFCFRWCWIVGGVGITIIRRG